MKISGLLKIDGMQKLDDKENLEAGAYTLKDAALHFHPLEATPEDNGVVLIQ